MSFSIKKVDRSDLKTLAHLADTIWHECFPQIISNAQIDYMVEKFQSEAAIGAQLAQGYEYYFLMQDDAPIGYTGIRPEEDALFLSKLYILAPFRGQGFSGKVFSFLKNLCAERNLKKIWLTVNRHNDTAIGVYRKTGFVVIREQVADIGAGFVMDDFVMEWNLEV